MKGYEYIVKIDSRGVYSAYIKHKRKWFQRKVVYGLCYVHPLDRPIKYMEKKYWIAQYNGKGQTSRCLRVILRLFKDMEKQIKNS